MKEGDNRRPVTAEEWSYHISEFASKCEFGSPEFQALSDFYNLGNLAEETRSEESSQFIGGGNLTHLPNETRRSLILHRIVLLEHTIDQKKASIPGYAKTYNDLTISFQELRDAAGKHAEAKYPNDPEQQTSYVHKTYAEMLDSISDGIFESHRLYPSKGKTN